MAEAGDKVTLELTVGEVNDVVAWGQRVIQYTQATMSKVVLQAQAQTARERKPPEPAPPEPLPANGNGRNRRPTGKSDDMRHS